MSHRITTQTKVTDREIAEAALNKAGWAFRTSGNSISIQGGPLNRATIDLATGKISGDTDWHSSDTLGSLNRYYGEAMVEKQVMESGGYIEGERIETEDSIILVANVMLA